jgi:dTDP-4-dehydrorhamnose 3,5-epimerase
MAMPVDITPTEIPAVLDIAVGRFGDDRGYFSETHSQEAWDAAGLNLTFVQDNLSKSAKGTLRGLHYQLEPHGQGKYVRVFTGSVFDVAVDIRKGSPTFGKWVGRTLTAHNNLAMYVPPGFAHGFIALEDDTLFFYKCTSFYAPQAERAILWNDPAIGIDWPLEPTAMADKDREAPLLADADFNFTWTE